MVGGQLSPDRPPIAICGFGRGSGGGEKERQKEKSEKCNFKSRKGERKAKEGRGKESWTR